MLREGFVEVMNRAKGIARANDEKVRKITSGWVNDGYFYSRTEFLQPLCYPLSVRLTHNLPLSMVSCQIQHSRVGVGRAVPEHLHVGQELQGLGLFLVRNGEDVLPALDELHILICRECVVCSRQLIEAR